MRAIFIASLFVALSACAEPEETKEPLAPAPDTYSIANDEFMRQVPRDICRAENESFLNDLIDRAKQDISPDLWPSFRFEDFNVTDADTSGDRLAVLRFRVEKSNGESVMMIAAGAFEPEGCKVGELKVAEGVSTAVFD